MNAPSLRRFGFPALILAAALTARADTDIGFIETFALAPDREATLGQLVPGTEDYYFFHALHYQSSGQKQKFSETLTQWAKRFPNSEQRPMLENREALLAYGTDPQKTLQHLRERLGLQFNHVQELPDQKPDLPTALTPSMISRERFLSVLPIENQLGALSDAEVERLLSDPAATLPYPAVAILMRIQRPDAPGLLPRIIAELKTPESRGFGSLPIHRALLPAQLDALEKEIPALAHQSAFVMTRIAKLAPGADTIPRQIRLHGKPGWSASVAMWGVCRRRSIPSRPTCCMPACNSTGPAVSMTAPVSSNT